MPLRRQHQFKCAHSTLHTEAYISDSSQPVRPTSTETCPSFIPDCCVIKFCRKYPPIGRGMPIAITWHVLWPDHINGRWHSIYAVKEEGIHFFAPISCHGIENLIFKWITDKEVVGASFWTVIAFFKWRSCCNILFWHDSSVKTFEKIKRIISYLCVISSGPPNLLKLVTKTIISHVPNIVDITRVDSGIINNDRVNDTASPPVDNIS